MAFEIVDGPLKSVKPARARYRTVHSEEGSFRVRIVDADSPTFGADFESAFKANVRRIRREDDQVKAAE